MRPNIALALAIQVLAAQVAPQGAIRPTLDSGGPLPAEQAAYDVHYYALDLAIDPADSSIAGSLRLEATVIRPLDRLVLDLDDRFEVTAVMGPGSGDSLAFVHRQGRLTVSYSQTIQPGEQVAATVYYHGYPLVAVNPPWGGGFTWDTTAAGQPWIAVQCEGEGADIWWPCKDHPSDEPDSMDLSFTVPEPLLAISNGRLRSVSSNGDGTRTFRWHVSTSINNYGVTLCAAPYSTIERDYVSVAGDTIPFTYWVLPENYDKGLEIVPEFLRHLRFLERTLGPYPFRADKYGVAETPYLGMEHQTLIAYGNQYRKDKFGIDALHLHELAHEWWGNQVTAADFNDLWLHEGFAVYMEALYIEEQQGDSALHARMAGIRPYFNNRKPVAPRESLTMAQIYNLPPDYTKSDGDIYRKGGWILHTLRYLIGDQAFFEALRRMAYPDSSLEQVTDGRQTRLATTDDFQRITESAYGRDLGWFFDLYLRQPKLPVLKVKQRRNKLILKWKTPGRRPFPMPVEVALEDTVWLVEMPKGRAKVQLPPGAQPVVDPRSWILRAE
ncbi:MAG: M1 family metallopeptidase [Candidatus Marinimicrobia bacterium]|nr:M1 family metallopeptidase [Candidatus Neomarinimicrobiota bacterium]